MEGLDVGLNMIAHPALCRRWQGLALAVWGAAASVAARGAPEGISVSYLLLSGFLQIPSICDLALSTAAGRSVVLQVYETMLVGELEPNKNHSNITTYRWRNLCDWSGPLQAGRGKHEEHYKYFEGKLWGNLRQTATAETSEPALALARCGALTRLIRWGGENCSRPQPQVGHLHLPPVERPRP